MNATENTASDANDTEWVPPTLAELATSSQASTKERFALQSAEGIVNPIELARLLGVRPQMIYNYMRAGKIASIRQNNTQKLTIALDEAQSFANNYLANKRKRLVNVAAEVDAMRAAEAE